MPTVASAGRCYRCVKRCSLDSFGNLVRWPRPGLLRCAKWRQARALTEVGQMARMSSSNAARIRRFTASSIPSSWWPRWRFWMKACPVLITCAERSRFKPTPTHRRHPITCRTCDCPQPLRDNFTDVIEFGNLRGLSGVNGLIQPAVQQTQPDSHDQMIQVQPTADTDHAQPQPLGNPDP